MVGAPQKIKKETISVTLDAYLLKWFDELIFNEKDFTSVSGVITVGMTEFRTRYKLEKEEMSVMDLLIKILQTPEGKRALDKIRSEGNTDNKIHTNNEYCLE
jgi:Arc/MetJ-type ribon-helix-helix transcriptional regulator